MTFHGVPDISRIQCFGEGVEFHPQGAVLLFQRRRRDVNAGDVDETGGFQPSAQKLGGWDQPEVAHPGVAAAGCQAVGVCDHEGLQEHLTARSCEIKQTQRVLRRISPVINHSHAQHGIEFDPR